MKNGRTLFGVFALVLAACGGGGSQAPAPTAATPAAPTPSPTPPPPPPPAAATPGTWTAALDTCVNPDVAANPAMGPQSLGHVPCLVGIYYATLISEDFQTTGARIGKACAVAVALDGTFTLSVDNGSEAIYPKTVSATISGVEQSANFAYGYGKVGTEINVSAIQYVSGGSVSVAVDPSRVLFTPFVGGTAKVRIEANYRPTGAVINKFLVCEG